MKGTLVLSRLFRGPASRAKSLMNTLQTPIVPRNILTSDTFWHAGHLLITPTLSVSGNLPSNVHRCPTTVISSAHSVVLGPEKVPPQYFILCTTLLTFWKCSHTKRLIPAFSGIVSYVPSADMYLDAGPLIGTSSMNGIVTSGISGCKMKVTSS